MKARSRVLKVNSPLLSEQKPRPNHRNKSQLCFMTLNTDIITHARNIVIIFALARGHTSPVCPLPPFRALIIIRPWPAGELNSLLCVEDEPARWRKWPQVAHYLQSLASSSSLGDGPSLRVYPIVLDCLWLINNLLTSLRMNYSSGRRIGQKDRESGRRSEEFTGRFLSVISRFWSTIWIG